MALKDIFKMTKANRYTADGREELIKAQEAETEDRRYNIGEISEKTGLQKTANGWVKPKSGKAPGAKTGEGKSPDKQSAKAASKNNGVEQTTVMAGNNKKTLNESMAQHLNKNIDAYKGYDQGSMEQLVLNPSGYEVKNSAKIPSGGKSVTYSKNGSKGEITLFFDKDGELEQVDTSGAERNHGTEQKKRGPGAIHTPGKGSVGIDKMKEAAEKGLKGQELKEFMTGSKSESKSAANKPDSADQHDKIGGEIKGNLEAAKYYFDKAQSFFPTDPSYKTYMGKAKEYNDKAKAQADDYGFDFEEMHNSGITHAINSYAKENTSPAPKTEKKQSLKLPDEKSSFSTDVNRMKKLKKEDYKQYTIQLEKLHSKYPINKWKDLYNKTLNDEAPRVLTGDTRIRVRK